jgi:hypothetical protein
MKGATPTNIALGRGVFKIDDTLIGLTRDGGTFSVEYEYRPISADGDRGYVKGRVSKDGATPKLALNHLEVLTALADLHTGITSDTTTKSGYTTIKGNGKIDDEKDYHTVAFIGETKDGRELTITVERAINLENIEWDLKDKDEIIDKVTYTGTYDEQADDLDEGWKVEYKTTKG